MAIHNQGSPNYDDEYVDIDIYGRGWDIVHGPGAYEAGLRECRERLIEMRNRKAGIEPGEEWQIDPDVYGRAHPTIFGPNSHLRNAEEAAATLRTRQEPGRENPRYFTISVRSILKAMKDFPKKVSSGSSKFWKKVKSSIKKSSRRQSSGSRRSISNESGQHRLSLASEVNKDVGEERVEEREEGGLDEVINPLVNSPTHVRARPDVPKHDFQFKVFEDPTHESGFRGAFVDVNKPGYVEESVVLPNKENGEDEVPDRVTVSSTRALHVTDAVMRDERKVKPAEENTMPDRSFRTEDSVSVASQAPRPKEVRRLSVLDLAMKYGEPTKADEDVVALPPALPETRPCENIARTVPVLSTEEFIRAPSSGDGFEKGNDSSQIDTEGTISSATRLLSRKSSSLRAAESKEYSAEHGASSSSFKTTKQGISHHGSNGTSSVLHAPSLQAHESDNISSESTTVDIFSLPPGTENSVQPNVFTSPSIQNASASPNMSGDALDSKPPKPHVEDKETMARSVSLSERILMFERKASVDEHKEHTIVLDASQETSVHVVSDSSNSQYDGSELRESQNSSASHENDDDSTEQVAGSLSSGSSSIPASLVDELYKHSSPSIPGKGEFSGEIREAASSSAVITGSETVQAELSTMNEVQATAWGGAMFSVPSPSSVEEQSGIRSMAHSNSHVPSNHSTSECQEKSTDSEDHEPVIATGFEPHPHNIIRSASASSIGRENDIDTATMPKSESDTSSRSNTGGSNVQDLSAVQSTFASIKNFFDRTAKENSNSTSHSQHNDNASVAVPSSHSTTTATSSSIQNRSSNRSSPRSSISCSSEQSSRRFDELVIDNVPISEDDIIAQGSVQEAPVHEISQSTSNKVDESCTPSKACSRSTSVKVSETSQERSNSAGATSSDVSFLSARAGNEELSIDSPIAPRSVAAIANLFETSNHESSRSKSESKMGADGSSSHRTSSSREKSIHLATASSGSYRSLRADNHREECEEYSMHGSVAPMENTLEKYTNTMAHSRSQSTTGAAKSDSRTLSSRDSYVGSGTRSCGSYHNSNVDTHAVAGNNSRTRSGVAEIASMFENSFYNTSHSNSQSSAENLSGSRHSLEKKRSLSSRENSNKSVSGETSEDGKLSEEEVIVLEELVDTDKSDGERSLEERPHSDSNSVSDRTGHTTANRLNSPSLSANQSQPARLTVTSTSSKSSISSRDSSTCQPNAETYAIDNARDGATEITTKLDPPAKISSRSNALVLNEHEHEASCTQESESRSSSTKRSNTSDSRRSSYTSWYTSEQSETVTDHSFHQESVQDSEYSSTGELATSASISRTETKEEISTSQSSSGSSSGSNSSDEYTNSETPVHEDENSNVPEVLSRHKGSSSKHEPSHFSDSEDEFDDDDDDDDIASSYVPRRMPSRRSGSRASFGIDEEEADNIVSQYLSRTRSSYGPPSENNSMTTSRSGTDSQYESESSVDLEEAVNNSRKSSGNVVDSSMRRLSYHSSANNEASSGGNRSDESIKQESAVDLDSKETSAISQIRPSALKMDDIPEGEPVAVVTTPTMDWSQFPDTSDDETVDSYHGDEDAAREQPPPVKKKKSWWSGWGRNPKRSVSKSSASSSEGETYQFAKRKSAESMFTSLRNVFGGDQRSGYQAPVSLSVRKKRSSNRESDTGSSGALTPTTNVRSYAQFCETMSTNFTSSSNAGKVKSASTYNSTFSPAVRTGGTFDEALSPAGPSTRPVTSVSNTSSYHTAKSAMSPLAPVTIKSTNTYNSTFSAGGPSSRGGAYGRGRKSNSTESAGDSTDGSSDFGDFVVSQVLPDSAAKAHTYNSAITTTEISKKTYDSEFSEASPSTGILKEPVRGNNPHDLPNQLVSPVAPTTVKSGLTYDSMFSSVNTVPEEPATGFTRSVRFSENLNMAISPQRAGSDALEVDSPIPEVSVRSMNAFLDNGNSAETSPIPAASVKSMNAFLDPERADQISVRSIATFTSPVSPNTLGTTTEGSTYNSSFTNTTDETVRQISTELQEKVTPNSSTTAGPSSSVSPIAPATMGKSFSKTDEHATGSSDWFGTSIVKVDTSGVSLKSSKSVKFNDDVSVEGTSEKKIISSGLAHSGRTNSDLPWMKEARKKLAMSKAQRKKSTFSPRTKKPSSSSIDEKKMESDTENKNEEQYPVASEHVEEESVGSSEEDFEEIEIV